jgi:hypothetical protein
MTEPSTTEYVLVHVGDAGVITGVRGEGKFLKSYDPDWRPEGYRGPQSGRAEWTDDLAEAMKFPDQISAFRCWRARSTTAPTRPDGKPNLPLTAYSIMCAPITDFEESR